MTRYFEIDWEASWSPLYGRPITLYHNTILWRSYDKSYPAVGERFAYYSSKHVASGYKRNNTRELGHFITTKPIKLMDYRFMRVLLSRLIAINSHDKSLQQLVSILISFGLCSLGHQIELVKMRYKDLNKASASYKVIEKSIKAMNEYYKPGTLIEQTGVRVAETTNDTFTMGFLQELFKDVFDGFISPRMYSPFHIEKPNSTMSPEIILFNPKASGIEEMIEYPRPYIVSTFKISDILSSTSDVIVIDKTKKKSGDPDLDMKLEFFMGGGEEKEGHYLDVAEEMLNKNDSDLSKIYKYGRKIGSKWKKKNVLRITEAPVPCVPVNLFPLEIG